MAKLYFRYGAMGSSKTANALMVHYNYNEKGKRAILLKPKIEDRDGTHIIKSRIGLSSNCQYVETFLNEVDKKFDKEHTEHIDAIIVDEAQFLTRKQVEKLSEIVDNYDIPVLCYGLRTDFRSELFEGSRRLMELADVIEEIATVCWCGKKAQFNARVIDGKIVRTGEQLLMGGNDKYISLCRKHFLSGEVFKST